MEEASSPLFFDDSVLAGKHDGDRGAWIVKVLGTTNRLQAIQGLFTFNQIRLDAGPSDDYGELRSSAAEDLFPAWVSNRHHADVFDDSTEIVKGIWIFDR